MGNSYTKPWFLGGVCYDKGMGSITGSKMEGHNPASTWARTESWPCWHRHISVCFHACELQLQYTLSYIIYVLVSFII